MSMWPEPYEFGIFNERDSCCRAGIIFGVGWDREVFIRLLTAARRGSVFTSKRRNELFCWRRLGNSESDAKIVSGRHTICRVVQVHEYVRTFRHKDSSIGRTIIFKGEARQIAKFISAPDDCPP